MARRRYKIKGVYKITCNKNGRQYIGSSNDITRRWNSHMVDLILSRHSNKAMQEDFYRYGLEGFSFTIVRIVLLDKDLLDAEQVEMDKIDRRIIYNTKRAVRKR